MEIVSRPEIGCPEDAQAYLTRLRQLLIWLDVCDGNMEEGSLRCDANISVRKRGAEEFGTKTEVKNMNSFRSVERAIEFEIARQEAALRAGEPLIQETRGWDDDRGVTYHMRTKETSDDYRYFPEPDLLPVVLSEEDIAEIAAQMPELPLARRAVGN